MVLVSPLRMSLGTGSLAKTNMRKLKIQNSPKGTCTFEKETGLPYEEPICSVCGIEVIFNLNIYELTGMCGTCTTGEARLNYEED